MVCMVLVMCGRVYVGAWRDDKMDGNRIVLIQRDQYNHCVEMCIIVCAGQGLFTYSNGDRYEGQFHHDVKHGRGVLTWTNGNKYDGEWWMARSMV